MKNIIRKIILSLTRQNIIWFFIKPLIKICKSFEFYRKKNEYAKAIINLNNYFDNLLIKSGPFKGLKYPDFISFGSALYPKLLGTYESELFPLINKLKLTEDYHSIINIGSAEGYYSVGFAIMFKNAIVYAYDINPKYESIITDFAKKNKVNNRLHFILNTNIETFEKLDEKNRSLIFCDCEGCEKQLFDKNNLNKFSNSDLIIETHDLAVHGVTNYLLDLFKDTHGVEIFYVKSKAEKMKIHEKEISNLSSFERDICIEEGRAHSLAWLFFKTKKYAS